MRLRETASGVVLTFALAVAVLGVGGALRGVAAVVALLTAASVGVVLTSRRGLGGISPLIALLGVFAGLTLLQLVPLPGAVLEHIQPVGHGLRVDGAELVNARPWSSITLDAPGSLAALTFSITLLGVAVVTLRLAANERGRLVCLGAVAGVCGVAAIIVGIHSILDSTSLYGVYTPNQASPPVLGPLLNANHLGGLMALGAVTATGLLFYGNQSNAARVSWLATGLGCTVVVFTTLSRGALLALLVGLGVTLAVIVAQRLAPAPGLNARALRSKFLITTLPITIIAVCALLVIVYTSAGTAADQLQNTSLTELQEPRSKFAAWRSAAELVSESPVLGIGRGAFESTFTRVHAASAFVTFSHLENEYVQAVVEWGIGGAAVAALALGWLLLLVLRRWRDGALSAAAIGGLTALGVQSSVDFGLELLGLAVPATIVAASITHVPLRALSRQATLRGRILRGAMIAALLGSAVVSFTPCTQSVDEDHRAIKGRASLDQVRMMVERHPLDYYAYALAAEALIADRDPRAITFLNHALVLHPTHAGLHQLAGRILIATGHVDQAAIEYAAGLRYAPDPRSVLREIGSSFAVDKAPDAIPTDFRNADLVVRTLVNEGYRLVALEWVARVVILNPRSLWHVQRMYELAVTAGDAEKSERAARLRVEIAPTAAYKLDLTQRLLARKAYDEVIALLADVAAWDGDVRDQKTGWLLLCDTYTQIARFDDAARCLRRLDGSGLMSPAERDRLRRSLETVAEQKAKSTAP